jgi:hypothetical protein
MDERKAGGKEVRPHLKLEDLRALQLAKTLTWGQKVMIGDQPAVSSGIKGDTPCFKVKGRLVYLPPCDPKLRTLRV